mgnify:CR=1 FL=1
MDPLALWEHITGPGGLLFTLGLILYLNYRRVWVWGKEADALREERDTWRSMALRTTSLAEQAAGLTREKG